MFTPGHGFACAVIDGKFETYMESISQYYSVRIVIAIAGFNLSMYNRSN
jgi:hypothetical protein